MITPFYKSPDRNFTLLKGDCIELLNSFEFKFDMIFADPPYSIEALDTIPDQVFSAKMADSESGILREGGVFILEHPANYSFENHPRFVKEKKYGNVHFSFFK